MNCRLCKTDACQLIHAGSRRYFLCPDCGLIFVPATDHLSLSDEKTRYDLHDNDADHEGYLRYLGEMADAVRTRIKPPARILDFGSGKNAILTTLLRETGFDCTPYDPLYSIGLDELQLRYDAIILCEVIEHLRDLPGEIAKIKHALNPGGSVFIRTRLYPPIEEFPHWWYKNDPTHINFFSYATIDKMAKIMRLSPARAEKTDIFICSDSLDRPTVKR